MLLKNFQLGFFILIRVLGFLIPFTILLLLPISTWVFWASFWMFFWNLQSIRCFILEQELMKVQSEAGTWHTLSDEWRQKYTSVITK